MVAHAGTNEGTKLVRNFVPDALNRCGHWLAATTGTAARRTWLAVAALFLPAGLKLAGGFAGFLPDVFFSIE